MATQLTSQLAALAASAGLDKSKRPKGQPSLLYEPHRAADIGVEDIFDTATRGFEALCTSDASLLPFKRTLFARSSLELERDACTQEQVAKLAASIRRFLHLLVPHFATSAATMALEYLVRKYRVHEFHVDEVLACMAPFHATAHYARLVQICKLEGSCWAFLAQMQKTGATLPRPALVKMCAKDHALMQLLCRSARTMHASHAATPVTTSFHTALLCETILTTRPLSSTVLRDLLSHLVVGLRPSATPAHREATHATLAVLLQCNPLRADAAAPVVTDICKHAPAGSVRSALMVAAHALTCQPSLQGELPDAAAAALIAAPGAAEELVALSQQGLAVAALVRALALACMAAVTTDEDPAAAEAAGGALRTLTTAGTMSDCAHEVSVAALRALRGGGTGSTAWVVRALEAAYPEAMDAAVSEHLAAEMAAGGEAGRTKAADVVHSALAGSVHAPLLGGADLTAASAVTSALPALREAAVRQLAESAQEAGATEATRVFVHRALIDRMLDDEASVAVAALAQPALVEAVGAVQGLCSCLQAAAHCMYGDAGGCAAVPARAGVQPVWSSKQARNVAKAALLALESTLSAASGVVGAENGVTEAADLERAVLAAVLPLTLGLSRSVGTAALQTLRALSGHSALGHALKRDTSASAGQTADAQQPASRRGRRSADSSSLVGDGESPGKKRGRSSSSKAKRISAESAAHDSAAAKDAGPQTAAGVARAVQEALASALCSPSDAAAAGKDALCTFAASTARGKHAVLLAVAAALRADVAEDRDDVDDASMACGVRAAQLAIPLLQESATLRSQSGLGQVSSSAEQRLGTAGEMTEEHLALLSSTFEQTHATMLKQTALDALSVPAQSARAELPAPAEQSGARAEQLLCLRLLCSLPSRAAFLPHIRALLAHSVTYTPSGDALEPLYHLFALPSAHSQHSVQQQRAATRSTGEVEPQPNHEVACNALRAFAELAGGKGSDTPATAAAVPYVLAACATATQSNVSAAAVSACGALAANLRSDTPPGVVALLQGLADSGEALSAAPAGNLLAALHASLEGAASRAEASSGPIKLSTRESKDVCAFLLEWAAATPLTAATAEPLATALRCAAPHALPKDALAACTPSLLPALCGPPAADSAPPAPVLQALTDACASAVTTAAVSQALQSGNDDAPKRLLDVLEAPARAAGSDASSTSHIEGAATPAARLRSCAAKALAGAWEELPAPSQQRLATTLARMAASEADEACRRAARKALQRLPLSQLHLRPLLEPLAELDADAADDDGSARRTKVHRAGGGNSALRADAEPSQHHQGLSAALASAAAALEVLTWRRDAVTGAHELLPVIQQCLAASTAAAASAPGAAYVTRLALAALAALAPAALQSAGDDDQVGSGEAIRTVVAALERADSAETAAAALEVLTALAAARPQDVLSSVMAAVELSGAQYEKVVSSTAQAAMLRAVGAVATAWPHAQLRALFDALLATLPRAPAALRAPLVASALAAAPSVDGLAVLTRAALEDPLATPLAANTPPTDATVQVRTSRKASNASTRGDEGAARSDASGNALDATFELLSGVFARESVETCAAVLARLMEADCASAGAGVAAAAPARRLVAFASAQVRLRGGQVATQESREALSALQKVLEVTLVQMQLLHQDQAVSKKTAVKSLRGLEGLLSALQATIPAPSLVAFLCAVVRSTAAAEGVRRSALRLLAAAGSRAAAAAPSALGSDMLSQEGILRGELCSAVPLLASAARTPRTTAQTRQAAIVALDAAVGAVGPAAAVDERAASALLATIPHIRDAASRETEGNEAVRASALAALGHMAKAAPSAMVAAVPRIVPAVLDATAAEPLGDEDTSASDPALELTAALGALAAIVRALPGFMSPYLPRIFAALLGRRVTGATDPLTRRAATAILADLPQRVEPRLLVPAMTQQLPAAHADGTAAMVALLGLARDIVRAMAPAAAAAHADTLATFLLSALTARSAQLERVDVDVAEAAALEALVATVLKLSEARFKPLFLRMVEWGTSVPAHAAADADAAVRAAALLARQTTFLRCVSELSTALRSVFTPYYAHLVDLLVECLAAEGGEGDAPAVAGNPKKKKRKGKSAAGADTAAAQAQQGAAVAARNAVAVACVHKACLYDSGGFIDGARFERLLGALLRALEGAQAEAEAASCLGASERALADRIELGSRTRLPERTRAAAAALVQLAGAATGDALWKMLNQRVLMLTRAEDGATRLAAIEIVYNLVATLREEYLPMLPETLPFLSELREDSVRAVEARTIDTIKLLEQLSEEELGEYLRA